ncbi:MAG: alpha/beta fold hydrolase [Acidimicrobiia bacterium]
MTETRRARRWSRILIGLVVLVGLTFYVGGGFVFANMIRGDALTPQPPTPDYGVYVTAVGDDTITLSSVEERDDTTHPGYFGLAWENGYGRLGEIIDQNGVTVTRSFELVSGVPPKTCTSTLGECHPADIEGWAYQRKPADVGLVYSEVAYESPLGTMGAWQVDSGDGTVWAIHAHGWRAARREAIRSLPVYYNAGVTSLVIDYRNDPDAPSDPSGFYRFGRTEWEDIEGAVEFAIDNGAEEIILVGYSTGASAHMAFLEQSDLADEVVAVVFDSPNIDMGETVRIAAGERTIPGTPIPIPGSLTASAMVIADLRWDIGWDEINYVDRASHTLTVPTLVFHGSADTRVPIEVSRRLQTEVPELVRLVETKGAGHVTSWNIDPAGYEEQLDDFLSGRTS